MLSSDPDDYPTHPELCEWANGLKIQLGSLIPTEEDELRVLQLLYSYRHLNGTDLDNLPSTDLIIHRARLTPGTEPNNVGSQICYPPNKEWWLRKLVQDGMRGGVYERTQHANSKLSAWNVRAVVVNKEENPKPTDEPRLTFDYSKVKEDMPGSYLELMSKVHDYLSDPRHKTFFQADIKHGYFSVVLHPDDRHLFAFTIPGIGQLQPTRMPQGSRSAGFTMSELMNTALRPIPDPDPEPSLMHCESAAPPPIAFYVDDLFCGHEDFDSQFAFLRDYFFPRIEWARLTLSFRKFRLFVNQIKALGVDHYVGGKLHVLSSLVETVAKWPEPKNAKGVQGFIGAVGITRRWVKNFAEIARPLSHLTGNVPWRWTQLEQLSFEILRIKCATRVAMHRIDWTQDIHLYTDASGFAGGLVITQFQTIDGNPKPVEVLVIYDTLTFSVTERKYQTYKRELCAMVKFSTKFQYLLRSPERPGIIHTDHKPLVHFLESSLHDGIYGHWAAKLQELNVKIVHIKGARNVVADGLSRTIFFKEDCGEDNAVSRAMENLHREGAQWIWKDGKGGFEEFLKSLSSEEKEEVTEQGSLQSLPVFALQLLASWRYAYECSDWFKEVYQFISVGELPTPVRAQFLRKCLNYQVDEDSQLWVHRGDLHLLCVPESKVAQTLYEAHDNSGHWAKGGTILKLQGAVYWPHQSTDIERYIAGCLQCAHHAPAQRSQLLRPIVIHRLFQLLAMDFIGPIKKATPSGYEYILHIMDYFSRYSMTYPSKTANVSDVMTASQDVFCRFTRPSAFFLDRGQHFENKVLQDFMDKQGVRLIFGPSGSSKSFSLIERGNRILEDVIRKAALLSSTWDKVLPKATMEVNSRIITHLRYSPLSILLGITPAPSSATLVGDASLSEAGFAHWVDSISDSRDHCRRVQDYLLDREAWREEVSLSNEEAKAKMADRYDQGITHRELDIGDLVLLHQKESTKLGAQWRGPFMVDKPGEHASYHIKQISGWRIKRTFHGDDLRVFKPRTGHLKLLSKPTYPLSQTIQESRKKGTRGPL